MRIRQSLIIFLTGVLAVVAVPVSAQRYPYPGEETSSWGLHGYTAAGAATLDLDDLNDRLEAAGYERFSSTLLAVGGGFGITVRRFLFEWEGITLLADGKNSTDGTVATDLAGGEGLFTVGYDVVSRPHFRLHPLIGFGAGAMELTFRPSATPSFGDILANPYRISKITVATVLGHAGAGTSYFIPVIRIWGMEGSVLLGVRAGYVFSVASDNWKFENTRMAGGPDMDMSGPYVRAMIGVRASAPVQ